MACKHSGSCELFPLMAMEPALILWKKHFCDSSFDKCARYQCSLNSKPVPSTLLPNGKQLAPRSREQLNEAALYNAIEKGCVPIIKSMIKIDLPQMASQTKQGLTPLMAAAQIGNVEIVGLMLEHGCDPWQKDPNGDTALDLATVNGHEACMDVLLNKMNTTTPDDYAEPFSISIEDYAETTGGNVVNLLKHINPFG